MPKIYKSLLIILLFISPIANSQDATVLVPHLRVISAQLKALNLDSKKQTTNDLWTKKLKENIEDFLSSSALIKKLGTAKKLLELTGELVCSFSELNLYADIGYGDCFFETRIELLNIRMLNVVEKVSLVLSSIRMDNSGRFTLLDEAIVEFTDIQEDVEKETKDLKIKANAFEEEDYMYADMMKWSSEGVL